MDQQHRDFVPGEVIVVFNDSMTAQSVEVAIESCGGCVVMRDERSNAALVRVEEGKEEAFIRMMRDKGVYAERNGVIRALYTPNDPYWISQWGPKAIKADEAWDISKGNKGVKVAIIDTGVDYTHEDLSANYVSGGYDWVNGDYDPMDDHGHGTHCAGIVAAVINNEKGVAGIAQVSIIAEKVLDSVGCGDYWDLGRAIEHAVDRGAKVISMSLGGNSYSVWLKGVCDDAWERGVVLVAAAGNSGSDELCYPAAYDSVIAVGATDRYNRKSYYSNYGEDLELVAPGDDIYSTLPSNGYGIKTGTSMATPHVSGVAALLFSANPELSNQDVRSIMQQTAIDLGAPGKDIYYGYGLVNASGALLKALPSRTANSIIGRITHTNNNSGIPNATVRLIQNGHVIAETSTNSTGYFSFANLDAGNYTINVSKPHFWDNSSVVVVPNDDAIYMQLWIRGDLNNNGKSADAGDVSLMMKASVWKIIPDWRYDLNRNGRLADAGDVSLIMKAAVGKVTL